MKHDNKSSEQVMSELAQMRQRILELEKSGIERKRIERVLCESEGLLSNIVNCSPIIMFALDRNGTFIYHGGRGMVSLGLMPDELIGRSAYEVYGDEPQITENIRRAFAGEEFASVNELGGVFWETWYSSLRDAHGEIAGVVGVAVDISERVKVQEALEISEEKYRRIFENIPVSIILTDGKGDMVDVSSHHVISIGKGRTTKQDYIGKNLITHPVIVAAGLSDAYRKLHESAEAFDLREVYFPITTGGVPRYFNIKGVPLFRKGKLTGAIIIHEDITERISVQEQIEHHYKTKDIINSILRISLEDIPLEEQLSRILEAMLGITFMPILSMGGIFLVDKGQPDVLVLKAEKGLPDPLKAACRRVPFDQCLCGKAAKERKIVFADSVGESHQTRYEGISPHGHYIVPIVSKDKLLGVIMLYVQPGHKPSREEEDLLEAVSTTLAGIIERKNMQDALDYGKERLRLLHEYSPEGIVIMDRDYRITYANSRAEELSSQPLSKLKDNPCYRIIHGRDSICEGCEIDEVLRTGKPRVHVKKNEVIASSGKENWIQQLWYPILDKEGRVESIVEIVRDITEQKNAEKALLDSEARHRALFEHSPISLWEEDFSAVKAYIDGLKNKGITDFRRFFSENHQAVADCARAVKIMDINNATLQMYKASSKEQMLQGLDAVLSESSYDSFKEELISIAEGRAVFETECLNKTLEGDEFDVSLKWSVAPGYEQTLSKVFVSVIDITQHKRIREILKKEKDRVQTYLDIAGVMIVALDADQTATLINKKGCQLLGYEPDEIIGRNWFDCFIPERERQLVKTTFDRIIKGELELAEYFENHVLCKDGTERYIAWRNAPLKDKQGAIVATLSSGEDITERKQAEAALFESEAKFRRLAEKSLVGIYLIQDGIFKYVNPRLAEIFGYSPEELTDKKGPRDLVIPEDVQLVEENIRKRISGEVESVHYTFRGTRKDGGIIYGEVYGSRTEYHNKPAIVGTVLDITERVRAEETLEENERFLSNIFDSIQDGISILDKDMNILRVSPTMERWYAHAMPLVGKKCYEAYHCHKSPCRVCPTRTTLATGKVAVETVPKRVAGSQTVGWLELHSFPLFDKQTGQINGVIEYVRDITERRRMETEREQLNRELLRSNKKLRQLALKDPHTSLYNHRYLMEVIEAEFYRGRRYGHPLSVIMLDIDYFKSINDVYGHGFGDLVLKQFAKLLKQLVRRYDVVVRFGGEEFVVISPGTDRPTALSLAQRILDAISLYNFGNKKIIVKLKLSISVASYPDDKAVKGMDLIETADQVLNKVKEFGGNKVFTSVDIHKKKRPPAAEKGEDTPKVKSLRDKIDRLTKRANQSLVEAVFAFAKTIELKDHYSGEHVERTVSYATEVAEALSLPRDEVERVKQAAILHDLGKIGISDKILLKRAKLTNKEYEEIKKHPRIGVDIIRPIQFLHSIIPLMLYHHERWDGKGYPSGLKGEDIPVGARIIAIADVYQALTSDRPYRKAFSKDKALGIIKSNSGTQFDPHIVEVFMKIIRPDQRLR